MIKKEFEKFTKLDVDRSIHKAIKVIAAQEGKKIFEVVNEALLDFLKKKKAQS